jgi:CheY-like chemotaxis protein
MPKLLLADDSVTIQRVIELTFADEDIDVITVGDGQRAIERIDADRPDIVLADVGMPERDGYEVSSYVKRHPELGHVPVILLTGAFERIDEQRARAAGADGVLAKPFEPQAVINQVRDLLSRRRTPAIQPALAATVPAAPAPTPWQVSQPPAPQAADDTAWITPDADVAGAPSDSLDEYFDRLDAAFANMGAAPSADLGFAPPPLPVEPPRPALVHHDRQPALAAAPPPPAVVPAPAIAAAPAAAASMPVAPTVAAPTPLMEARVPERGPESPRAAAGDPSGHDAREAVQVSHSVPISPVSPPAAPPPVLQPPPPLADAFTALLAAERGQRARPTPVSGPQPPVAVTDALVEEVTRRVLERISDRVVRETVGDMVLQVADRLVREEIERIKAAVR